MARIAGVNIPNHKHAWVAMTAIFGIGNTHARKICDDAGVAQTKKVKDLTDAELDQTARAGCCSRSKATCAVKSR